MKAYKLSIKDDPDQGEVIVFAQTAREAKNNWTQYLDADNFLDKLVHRAPEFDGMEGASDMEIMTKQWQEGWRWYDCYDVPDVEEDTVEDFQAWFRKEYENE
ncbi:hypothetical protein AM2_073 [Lactococcus phage AM2]|uniref:Uncharacterized protein n=7 Tax=Audreyjarvisvirus AM1 TaxID=2845188 RepID=A0A1W6JLN3_9CAUD|nr:hypothetical protein H1Z30_gp074 [Lactococcus phage AM1]ARM66378.1 hypothetical protein AM2_073 [Lactococcus phage AM2]ARM66555.1 hypothetical protein AM3_073 [Lactococcus phage AM3]ARM67108.1 hypothetical protein AM8_073 [Lactococcus phage AM8]ARM67287.1 hypothetical protein AM9_074 [Lactococcus phage AM9]ARM67465.1 hypothetical protein AM11_073 [Lactococcus phage AM11]ARQ95653.1 hypothetical protein AM12_074 [Lactococcus phage AM12]